MATEVLKFILSTQCALDPKSLFPDDYGPSLATSKIQFDFIVVGAGSAGSAVAARLSEVDGWNVLLLEAGGYPSALTEVPAFSFIQNIDTEMDWKYENVNNGRSCLGFKGSACRVPRGKCLGGSSSINALIYVRGLDSDYNKWRDMGNPGWGAEDVLKYFKKSEDSRSRNGTRHGKKGPLTTTYTPMGSTARRFMLKAAEEAGFMYSGDEADFGYFESLSTVRDGKRCSAAKAYLAHRNERKNLYVALNAHVTKVLIEGKAAVGVEVIVNGEMLKVKAQKEVIVSGGSINSPQILMLSGIGPKKHLEEFNIKVKKDLPVGKNLEDHLFTTTLFIEIDPLESDEGKDDWKRYCEGRKGSFATIGAINMLWFFNTKNKTDVPNIQTYHIYAPKNDQVTLPSFLEKMAVNSVTSEEILSRNKERDLINYMVSLTHPKSRGWVKLRSTNPLDKPLININLLSDPKNVDINTLVEAIPFLEKILDTTTMKSRNARFFLPDIPLCRGLIKRSPDYWRCLFRNMGSSIFHMSGTCKMGPVNSSEAVVDDRLRVHGIENLRVIDAGVIPSLINRNTNAAVIMIAEKGADLIKEDHRKTVN